MWWWLSNDVSLLFFVNTMLVVFTVSSKKVEVIIDCPIRHDHERQHPIMDKKGTKISPLPIQSPF